MNLTIVYISVWLWLDMCTVHDCTYTHTHSHPHRHMLSDEHNRDKERFVAKEREEAVKKARMSRMADIKARQQVKQQIEEDRK